MDTIKFIRKEVFHIGMRKKREASKPPSPPGIKKTFLVAGVSLVVIVVLVAVLLYVAPRPLVGKALQAVSTQLTPQQVVSTPLVSCVDVPQGLVAWWRMEEISSYATGGKYTKDSSNNQINLDWVGKTTTVLDGKVGKALGIFSGYLRHNDDSRLEFGAGDFTIEGWIRADDISANAERTIVEHLEGGTKYDGYWLFMSLSDKKLSFFYGTGTDYKLVRHDNLPIATGTWTHIAVVRNGPALKLFVNAQSKSFDMGAQEIKDSMEQFVVGAYTVADSAAGLFLGGIDELSVYKRALTDGEIKQIWAAGLSKCYTEASCIDKVDNDGDGDLDCKDSDCSGKKECTPSEDSYTLCKDKKDNDNDGKVDCEDTNCQGASVLLFGTWKVYACPSSETSCTDGKDNDADGKVDCNDSDCSTSTSIELNAKASFETSIQAGLCPGATITIK